MSKSEGGKSGLRSGGKNISQPQNEAEVEAIRDRLLEKEARLQAEEKALREERENFIKEKEITLIDLKDKYDRLTVQKDSTNWDLPRDDSHDRLLQEVADLRRELRAVQAR